MQFIQAKAVQFVSCTFSPVPTPKGFFFLQPHISLFTIQTRHEAWAEVHTGKVSVKKQPAENTGRPQNISELRVATWSRRNRFTVWIKPIKLATLGLCIVTVLNYLLQCLYTMWVQIWVQPTPFSVQLPAISEEAPSSQLWMAQLWLPKPFE